MKKTGERLILETRTQSAEDQVVYLRNMAGYNFVIKRLRDAKNLLEVGCTGGFGTREIAKKAKNVTGVDKDKKTIQYAISKNKNKNIKYRCADATNLPFEDEGFDVVVALQMIEHIKDDRRFLSEVKRVLKKGGLFFCSTPNKSIRYVKNKPWNRFHVREYNYKEFKNLLDSYFDNVNIFSIAMKGEVYKFEKKRLRNIYLLNKIDFLNLRQLISPELQSNILENIKTLLYKLFTKKKKGYSLEDFFITQDNFNRCLDFIAIAKKS